MPFVATIFICVDCETGYFYCPKHNCQALVELKKYPKTFESAIIYCPQCEYPLWISFKTVFALTQCYNCEIKKQEVEVDA